MTKVLVQPSQERAESMNKTVDAISAKEAEAESGNRANTPPGWKPYKKVSKANVDAEVLSKTKNMRRN